MSPYGKRSKCFAPFSFGAGDEESAAAPPVADKARRFRGSGTIGAHLKGGRGSYCRDGERRDAREMKWSGRRGSNSLPPPWQGGALPDELRPQFGAQSRSRTSDTGIFSPLRYQLSNRGISSGCCSLIMATTKGLEPSTSGVTGRRSNQLNYMATFWWEQQ